MKNDLRDGGLVEYPLHECEDDEAALPSRFLLSIQTLPGLAGARDARIDLRHDAARAPAAPDARDSE